ncbi:MAG: MoaD/ThiS family protein [Spirochaetia bacterium]
MGMGPCSSGEIRITVKLFGSFRRLSDPGTPGLWTGRVPEGTTVRDLFGILGTSPREAAAAAVNGKTARWDDVLSDGAAVYLVPPVGGG